MSGTAVPGGASGFSDKPQAGYEAKPDYALERPGGEERPKRKLSKKADSAFIGAEGFQKHAGRHSLASTALLLPYTLAARLNAWLWTRRSPLPGEVAYGVWLGRLPDAARGYYREFTVTTPGSRDRGARRIVSGGNPPTVFYYSDDHYRSFRRIRE